MIEQQKFDGACDDIAQGKFYQAFSALAELYSDGDENDRQAVYALLTDVFYTPNYDALKGNYKNNKTRLKEYPYWFGSEIPAFEDLGFLVFPCDGNTCFIYYKDDDTFCEVEVNSETETKYFFATKAQPVLAYNEVNEFNISFLVDNVRASEDVAMDNHVYLYYENPDLLFAFMQVVEIDYFLVKKKVIFLVGSENRELYPLDFMTLFGIDYSSMEPQPLRIEELKRITPVISLFYTGQFMLCQLFNAHRDIVMFHAYHFFARQAKKGKYKRLIEKINNETYTADYQTVVESIGDDIRIVLYDNHDVFFDILFRMTYEKGEFTAPEWFRAISIAKYYTENGKDYTSRFCPAIFMDYHYGELGSYRGIIDSFKYRKALSIVRDPIIRLARFLNYGNMIKQNTSFDQVEYLYLAYLYNEKNTRDIGNMRWFCIIFEEIKENPSSGAKLLCRLMGVPYDTEMMHPEKYPLTSYVENEFGERLQGFEKSSIKRNTDGVCSELDRLRLAILYAPLLERYGYTYSNNIEPLNDEEIKLLFSLPYRFEKYMQINPPGDIEEIHKQVVEVMCKYYFISRKKDGIIYPEKLSLDYLN